jgi:hypothetical protein
LAIHVSNRYLDLVPVVRGLADHLKLKAIEIYSKDEPSTGVIRADWMLASANQELLNSLAPVALSDTEPVPPPLLWTDDYSDLFRILK